MNFENLQKDLFERKLKLEEYFSKTFKLLKVFLKEYLDIIFQYITAADCNRHKNCRKRWK